MKRAPVYLVVMGEIYRLTRAGYRRYLEEIEAAGAADVSRHGECLGRAYRATDIVREDARVILAGGKCSWLPPLVEPKS